MFHVDPLVPKCIAQYNSTVDDPDDYNGYWGSRLEGSIAATCIVPAENIGHGSGALITQTVIEAPILLPDISCVDPCSSSSHLARVCALHFPSAHDCGGGLRALGGG